MVFAFLSLPPAEKMKTGIEESYHPGKAIHDLIVLVFEVVSVSVRHPDDDFDDDGDYGDDDGDYYDDDDFICCNSIAGWPPYIT